MIISDQVKNQIGNDLTELLNKVIISKKYSNTMQVIRESAKLSRISIEYLDEILKKTNVLLSNKADTRYIPLIDLKFQQNFQQIQKTDKKTDNKDSKFEAIKKAKRLREILYISLEWEKNPFMFNQAIEEYEKSKTNKRSQDNIKYINSVNLINNPENIDNLFCNLRKEAESELRLIQLENFDVNENLSFGVDGVINNPNQLFPLVSLYFDAFSKFFDCLCSIMQQETDLKNPLSVLKQECLQISSFQKNVAQTTINRALEIERQKRKKRMEKLRFREGTENRPQSLKDKKKS